MNIVNLPVKEILASSEFNCRGHINPSEVIDLKESIEKVGLHQPIVVRIYSHPPYKWQVIMGHRRHKAFEVLKKETIPCIINNDLSEIEARTANLVENLERKDLTIMQEAKGIQVLMNSGLTLKDIARRVNKSISWVYIRETALTFSEDIQREIHAGFINQEHILDLVKIPSLKARYAAVKEIKELRESGNKRRIRLREIKKKKENPTEKRLRTVTEIFKIQDLIRDNIGNGLPTILLGWTTGLVSTQDIYDELTKECEILGKTFKNLDKE